MKRLLFFIILIASISSCELTNFDLQENPNELGENSVSPDFLLNEIQISFADFLDGLIEESDEIMRYNAMLDSYTDIVESYVMDDSWESAYKIRGNTLVLEKLAEDNEGLQFHRGMARVLYAYSIATLVDYLGDVPFYEANDPNNFNPSLDDGETVYGEAFNILDSAIVDLQNATFKPATDLFYNGDATKWIKAAKTVQLKLAVNTGDVSKINSLISEGMLILNEEDDFAFQYSTGLSPDSRHPYFQEGYVSGGTGTYMGNYFMWLLKDSKNKPDPRLRYYVYRQTNVNPQDLGSSNFLSCAGNPDFDYCYIGDYYWGRDHGDDSASPNDRDYKAVWGQYPAGGAFDADNPTTAVTTENDGGAGIYPILLSSYVKFLMAEAKLRLGTSGDATSLLRDAVQESMDKVLNFSSTGVSSDFEASDQDVSEYITDVIKEYNGAFATNQKLDIVIREFYLATYGNPIEAYNFYRRTGFPSNIQAPVRSVTVPFPRTFFMPLDAVNANTSINQRPITTQVFWDKNPAGFIK